MNLTNSWTGADAAGKGLETIKTTADDRVIALAGNPNVGKSTVFNALTGLNQHTGNWPGKTVANAQGRYLHQGRQYVLVDIPGTYSLMANSAEEEVARDFICFGGADITVVVADATCLERNLNLILQILEVTPRVVVCVNLLDEARKKKIRIDLPKLSEELGVPVAGCAARSKEGLSELKDLVSNAVFANERAKSYQIHYSEALEEAVSMLMPRLDGISNGSISPRWIALRLLETDDRLEATLSQFLKYDLKADEDLQHLIGEAKELLFQNNIEADFVRDSIVSELVERGEEIYRRCVTLENESYNERDRKLDRLLTSKLTGIPVMLVLLSLVFWITLTGANYPSALLSGFLFGIQDKLTLWFAEIGAPVWLHGALVLGVYRTLAWVVSVMLPPMAIFFPLFTLLEDSGYLPRVAFNMDKFFKKAGAHGKQCLSMCQGFGCNACGVIGCRIIDSPRERMIAILTNCFVPCNGRFPTLIALITMFFAVNAGPFQSLASTLILTGVILFGIFMTLFISKLLSKTMLKGMPSSFALELPPYRAPQIGKVIVRSVFDRTLFVLGRAAAVAAPAGLLIWIMSNVTVGGISVLMHCANFLDPFARLIGLDGVILMAFLLGFPANEIVVPIILMSYLATGSILAPASLAELRLLLTAHGWTAVTAVCTMLFSLMHFPCGTTCFTIYKETKSLKWTAVAFLLPTVAGLIVCFLFANAARLLGIT